MHPLLIIGTGLAGYTLAREYRKLDASSPMLLITADDGGFYSKPMLSNAFAQRRSPAQLVTQSAAQIATQLGATILTGTRVLGIDAAAKSVMTSGGTFEYDKLALAAGAQPIRLAIEGDAAEEVMSVNHVQDYARFRQRIDATGARSRVAILGAGLIGCEFADDLAGAGHETILIDPNPLPLSALAAPALSQGLHAALSKRGVRLELGTVAARVEHSDGALALTLANGTQLIVDVILSAVGLRPDLRLAQSAGMATGRGILVDVHGQTSAPHVYALGDCAEYAHADGGTRVLPYIAPLMTAARAIARTLSGQPTAIDIAKPAPVIVKTPSFPLALVPPPALHVASGSWHSEQRGTHTVCRFHDGDGVMRGFGVAPQEAGVRQALLAELDKASVAVI